MAMGGGYLAIFTTFMLEAWCRLEPLPDELTSRLSVAKCIGESSDRFFQEGEIVLVSLPIQEVSVTQASAVLVNNLIFAELFGRCRLSIVIKKTTESRKTERYQKTIDNYVIQVRNLSELEQNLNVLQGYSSWNPHAKFIVFSVAIYGNNAAAAAIIIQRLWEMKIVNGIVLLPHPKNTSIFEVFSWFPFSHHHCGDGFDEVKVIDRCSFGAVEVGTNWFPDKIPGNLNGCPVRVRTVIWPPYVLRPEDYDGTRRTKKSYNFTDGLEILLMNTMAKMGNFSAVYTVSDVLQDWGAIYSNGTATGALLCLKNEEVDVAISSFAASVESHMYFDSIPYAIPESLVWCVPHAQHIPHWENLLVIISADAGIMILILYVLVSVFLWKLSSFERNELAFYKRLRNCLQSALSVMVNTSVHVQPKSTTLRALFVVWIFFSLHLDVDYQTYLTSVFTKPKYQRQIESVTEIFENHLKLWFLSTTKRYFMNKGDWLSEKVLENWEHCADISDCLRKTAYDRDSATCTPRLFKKFSSGRYINSDGEPLLYCFKESIVTYPLEMLLRKGYPLRQYFNVLIGRIASSGLMAQWERRILELQMKNSSEVSETSTRKFKITVDHLNVLFALLGLGYVLGFVILFLEMYIHDRKNPKKRKLCTIAH